MEEPISQIDHAPFALAKPNPWPTEKGDVASVMALARVGVN